MIAAFDVLVNIDLTPQALPSTFNKRIHQSKGTGNLCYTQNMNAHIAVDIGGTQLRAGLYFQNTIKPAKLEKILTHRDDETPLDRLISLISSIWPEDNDISCIGVAAPGPINPFEGIIYTAPNISGWVDFPLVSKLRDHFNVPVKLGNDANLAALGEWQYGAGKGHSHLIYLTVSTGIGGGVIINNFPLLGERGLAAEIGHMTVLPDGPICGCGQPGHLEALASGTAIARWFSEALKQGKSSILSSSQHQSAKDIAEAAIKGDRLAVSAFNRAGTYLGLGIINLLHIFNPSIVIIGGGVSKSGNILFDSIKSTLEQRAISPRYLEGITITNPMLGDESGLVGALVLARSRTEDQ
jgi:glucokinase